MNRREFLKSIGITSVAAILPLDLIEFLAPDDDDITLGGPGGSSSPDLEKFLLNSCNRKWQKQVNFHNLTPSLGTTKFVPATRIHSFKEYSHYYDVILDGDIRGLPKFRITQE